MSFGRRPVISTVRRQKNFDEMANVTVRQLGTRDLLALILFVAIHFAFAKFFRIHPRIRTYHYRTSVTTSANGIGATQVPDDVGVPQL